MIPLMNNIIDILGLLQLGYLVYFFSRTVPYYIKNKSWPAHPAELKREQENIIFLSTIKSLEEKNKELFDEMTELKIDMKNIWSKTLNRLPEK